MVFDSRSSNSTTIHQIYYFGLDSTQVTDIQYSPRRRISSRDNASLKFAVYGPKCPVFKWSAKSYDTLLTFPQIRCIVMLCHLLGKAVILFTLEHLNASALAAMRCFPSRQRREAIKALNKLSSIRLFPFPSCFKKQDFKFVPVQGLFSYLPFLLLT